MGPIEVDASNACIPETHGLIGLTPPLPSTTRGEPIKIDGKCGRINTGRPVLVYPSGRLVVVRELGIDILGRDSLCGGGGADGELPLGVKAFVYRGHTAQVTCVKFSPSGSYVASGDIRGNVRVWAYDNPAHLCKLQTPVLAGPIRDISWDFESKRLCVVGEGPKSGTDPCSRVIQWDTGVNVGELSKHGRNRASTCDFRPCRPMRIITGGTDDASCFFHKGPPFARIPGGLSDATMHERGAIHCVRYSNSGDRIASVGTDGSIVFYKGNTMEAASAGSGYGLIKNIHASTIYACAWNSTDEFILTCGADGTVTLVKVFNENDMEKSVVVHKWDVAKQMMDKNEKSPITKDINNSSGPNGKVPVGGMQLGCDFLDGDIPVTICVNGEIAILPLPDGILPSSKAAKDSLPQTKFLSGHQSPVSSLAIDYANGIFYTSDSDGIICAWDLASGSATGRIHSIDNSDKNNSTNDLMNKVHYGAITGMVTSHDGNLLSIGWDDRLRLSTDFTSYTSLPLPSQPNGIARGKYLVAILTVGGIILIQPNKDEGASHSISDPIQITEYDPICLCISKDDSKVYVGGNDNNIHIYTVTDNTLQKDTQILSGVHLQPISSLELSHDGTKLASADIRDVCVWDVTDTNEITTIVNRSRWCFHRRKIVSLAWTWDDAVLASGGSDDSIFFWCPTKKMKRIHYDFAHRGGVTALKFLPDKDTGNEKKYLLLSVGNDACINRWDITKDVARIFGL